MFWTSKNLRALTLTFLVVQVLVQYAFCISVYKDGGLDLIAFTRDEFNNIILLVLFGCIGGAIAAFIPFKAKLYEEKITLAIPAAIIFFQFLMIVIGLISL